MSQKVPIKSLLSRPRFKVFTHLSKQEFIDLIKKHLETNSTEYGGYANQEVAMIRVRKDKDKYAKHLEAKKLLNAFVGVVSGVKEAEEYSNLYKEHKEILITKNTKKNKPKSPHSFPQSMKRSANSRKNMSY